MAESKIKKPDIDYVINATNLHANISSNLINARRTGDIIIVSGYISLSGNIPYNNILFSLTTPLIRSYSVITRYANGTSLPVIATPNSNSSADIYSNVLLPADTYYLNMVLPAE